MSKADPPIIDSRRYHPRAIGNTHAIALSLVPDIAGRLLDAGAGDRWLSARLRERGHKVISADIHFDERPLPTECLETDLNEPLPFPDGAFDGILSIETIEHLENPWAFMRELSRVVRPGGFVVLSTPNLSSIFSRLLMVPTGRLLWFQPRDLEPLGHISPILPHLLVEMARRVGLSVEERAYSWGRVPLLNLRIRTKSALFGECLIIRLRKSALGSTNERGALEA